MKRVALTQALHRKQGASERAVALEARERVRRARRLESTNRAQPLGEGGPVKPNQEDENVSDDHEKLFDL
jgi:hypothetical protein